MEAHIRASESIGTSKQMEQILAEMRARLKPSQKESGPSRRDTDLTDGRLIQSNWIDHFHRCAHQILQELQFKEMIKLDPISRVSSDRDVQRTGQTSVPTRQASVQQTKEQMISFVEICCA